MTPFQTILADPPWRFDAPLKMKDGVKRAASDQYPTMTVDEICGLARHQRAIHQGRGRPKIIDATIAGHPIADVALLGLWIPANLLLDGAHRQVCEAWGFEAKQIVPWFKGRIAVGDPLACEYVNGRPVPERPKLVIQPGMGALTRVCVEYLVLATRGKYTGLVQSHRENGLLLAEEDAFILAPKSQHSRKPDQQYALLEKLFPEPRLELFARRPRAGWTSWGNEMPPAERADEPRLPLVPTHEIEVTGGRITYDGPVHQEEIIEWG